LKLAKFKKFDRLEYDNFIYHSVDKTQQLRDVIYRKR